jgi:hypothetical protein
MIHFCTVEKNRMENFPLAQLPNDVLEYMKPFLCIDHRRALGIYNKIQVPAGLIENLQRVSKMEVCEPSHNVVQTRMYIRFKNGSFMMNEYVPLNNGTRTNMLGIYHSVDNSMMNYIIGRESW